ncbi:Zn finger protein HypA/HybF (possibly regulating hydrogenase expression) [Sphaerochaeta pleomorpha str. Grapes]|uniref:Hydrogenase maturation factor HypA n=1 Tax=Sphaerochaeta pleomorpha (strain ATCC BAA-1885 / DSM 22778 / Grapes) TaxID=158190 RepID=G8QTX5_SPHPG|nr:hydrogenase maturation nickel metallochaperone HypA [Sphaerochaeta pleomorpha]AEV29151.1 Zn finger protein HypA/HybF (possibly regulating hydrogenase expression) [Sphaerochaeta pleomorpha str. Grapes]
MHELGVVMEVIKVVEKAMKDNDLQQVEKIVLQIGEISSMIPRYILQCFPAAVEGTCLEDTELAIEILPANALCKDCRKVYPAVPTKGVCPHCGSENKELLGGREFNIKEIVAC